MVEAGLMTRWNIAEIYGMHNMPGLAPGHFALRPGPIMAAADQFTIEIEGKGAHAAKPDQGNDPIVVGAHLVAALQTIASRNVDPIKSVVVSVTQFHAGTAFNIIPPRAALNGTVRTLDPAIRDLAESRFRAIVDGAARMFGAAIRLDYERGYPAVLNHARETHLATAIAAGIAGAENVNAEAPPVMGGEDFSYMLLERPGAFIFIGNGDSAGLHHPAYDFNDEILPVGMQYWAEIVKARSAA
jgi:hippurate hydrolase